MKRKISMFAATLGICLLLGAGNASAEPWEPCEADGRFGHSFELINGQNGWHLWQCWSGSWEYVTFCGEFICIV